MNHLRELIRNINPGKITARYGRNTSSSILARVEQVIFDQLLQDREITDVAGARRMLSNLHAQDAPDTSMAFSEYLDKLESMQTPDKFTVELTELMTEVNESTNPMGLLQQFISQERESGLVTQQDVLPEGFWHRDGEDAEIAGA